ncbi:hypothetical protein BM1_00900 [Bipolaris maydis]|nr:hypothetical protein BM1_00900 [Bipolaris maydis]
MATPNTDETSCDEYPYASVVEGGSGAILRCTQLIENTAEGTALSGFFSSVCGNQPCTFMITFGNPGGGQTPYCLDGGGANDGFEYSYQGNGNYQLANRDLNATEDGGWGLHEPDPADYFPPHLRREFLLADGSRTIVSSRNLTASYDDAIFYSVRNGTVFQTHVVKELLHFEKRLELQDPALRDSNYSLVPKIPQLSRIHSPGMTMVSWETTWDPDGKDGHRGARSRDVPSRQDGAISDGRTRFVQFTVHRHIMKPLNSPILSHQSIPELLPSPGTKSCSQKAEVFTQSKTSPAHLISTSKTPLNPNSNRADN